MDDKLVMLCLILFLKKKNLASKSESKLQSLKNSPCGRRNHFHSHSTKLHHVALCLEEMSFLSYLESNQYITIHHAKLHFDHPKQLHDSVPHGVYSFYSV
jgi:hypothetical protein